MAPRCLSPCAGQLYRYTADLVALESCQAPYFLLPSARFASVVTSLDADVCCLALRDHPDRTFAAYIVGGIVSGFWIGFKFGSVACQSATRNMPSASQCEQKIDKFLATECAAGRVLGPFSQSLLPMVHINRLGFARVDAALGPPSSI